MHHNPASLKRIINSHRGLQLSGLGRLCPAYVSWVRAFACTPVIPAVPYMPTGLAGCSVGPGISRGARKLTRIPLVIKIIIIIIIIIINYGMKLIHCFCTTEVRGLAGNSQSLHSKFESLYARMSFPRCLICLLDLQGVQWFRELVVVHVSWLGYPEL
jgi:hypothetical protein